MTSAGAALRAAGCLVAATWAGPAVGGCVPPSPRTDAHRACPTQAEQPDDPEAWQCPSADGGRVVVDRRFDADGDGLLEYCEIQCAIDCLDGDSDQERTLARYEASRSPGRPPSPIGGGELVLDPALGYRVDRPLGLPLLVEGSLILRGNGARLELVHSADSPPRSFAAIERLPIEGSNHCDVNAMADAGSGWLIENLWFAISVPDERLRATKLLKGIEVHGARQLTIRSCQFRASTDGGFDRAVELHACRGCLVDASTFTMTRRSGVSILDADGCGDDEADACWAPCSCDDPRPRWLGRPGRCAEGSGSDGTVVRKARFYTGGPPAYPKSVAVRAHDSSEILVDAPTFEGLRPLHYVWRTGTEGAFTLRNPRFEGGASTASPLVRNSAPGVFVIDGPEIVTDGPGPQWFYDVSAATGASLTVVQDAPLATLGSLRFSASPVAAARDLQFFAFVNLAAPLQESRYWIGEVPRFTYALSPERWVLPPAQDPADGAAFEPVPRQVWIDDGQLKFCCDPGGRVLKALTETVTPPVVSGP